MKLVAINSSFASTMMITYDDKYERFSPGNVLDEFMMRYIFENYQDSDGRHLDIDFGPGCEHYKMHWSRRNVHPTKSSIVAASRWGLVKLRLHQSRARIRRLAPVFMQILQVVVLRMRRKAAKVTRCA